jgi:hypothetical protein
VGIGKISIKSFHVNVTRDEAEVVISVIVGVFHKGKALGPHFQDILAFWQGQSNYIKYYTSHDGVANLFSILLWHGSLMPVVFHMGPPFETFG